MSQVHEKSVGDKEDQITPARSQETTEDKSPENLAPRLNEKNENGLPAMPTIPDKDQEHSESLRDNEGRARIMSGLPSINITELTNILRDPSMPSQKIMNEVADKIILKSEESESSDGSVGSGVVGMKGVLDCIFEVTFQHTKSDNSDDDDDDCYERIPREIPCNLCSKVFGSTMTWKTHVLVAHQDPSVLNIRRMSGSKFDRRDKHHPLHRRHPRTSSKSDSDVTDVKILYGQNTANKHAAQTSHHVDRIPFEKRRFSLSKPVPREAPGISLSFRSQLEPLPTGEPAGKKRVSSSHKESDDATITVSENKDGATIKAGENKDDATIAIAAGENIDDATIAAGTAGENKDDAVVTCDSVAQANEGHPSLSEGDIEPHKTDQTSSTNQSILNAQIKSIEAEEDTATFVASDMESSENRDRKRKTSSPFPRSPSSLSAQLTTSNPKRSRKDSGSK